MAERWGSVRRKFDGKEYYRIKKGITKAEAARTADWHRRGGFSARINKIARGNYEVWILAG